MPEEKETSEEIVEQNSVETTTDLDAPVGERTEVTESGSVTTEVTTEPVTPVQIEAEIAAAEDDE